MQVRVRHIGGDAWEVSLPPKARALRGLALLRPRRTVHAPDADAARAEGERILAHEFPAYRLGAGMDSAELMLLFIDRWRRQFGYSPDTAHDYELLIRRYVVPHFAMDADKVTADDLEGLYAFLLEAGGRDGGPVGLRTVHKLHAVIGTAFHWMEREGIVDRDPTNGMRVPAAPAAKKRALTEAEAARLLAELKSAIEGPLPEGGGMLRVHAFGAWTGWWTGARVGEVCALLRGGVALSRGRITFDGSVTERGSLRRKSPKTAAGVRTISPGDEYMASLRSFIGWANSQWIGPDVRVTEATPVMCRADGGLVRPSDMSAAFKDLCARAHIDLAPGESFHSLRHTAATLMLADGVNPDEARRRLGHAKVATTIDNYGHAMPAEDAAAAASLEGITKRIEEGGALWKR